MRILTTLFFGLILMLSFNSAEAQTDPQEDLQNEAKKQAMKISDHLNLDEDEAMFVFRYVYNDKMQRQKLDQLEPGSDEYNDYEAQIEEEMRMNLASQFGESSVEKILDLYKKHKE